MVKIKIIPKLYIQWMAIADQGKQVEFLEADEDGAEVTNGLELARVLVDDDEKSWIEIYMNCGPVRVPLDEFKDAIEYAANTVHSERFYERMIEKSDKEDT
jgi:hypothetical protein